MRVSTPVADMEINLDRFVVENGMLVVDQLRRRCHAGPVRSSGPATCAGSSARSFARPSPGTFSRASSVRRVTGGARAAAGTTITRRPCPGRPGMNIAASPVSEGVRTGADILLAALRANGITSLFGLPGGQLDDMFDAMCRAEGDFATIRSPARTGGPAYMAYGAARSTGKPSGVPGRAGTRAHEHDGSALDRLGDKHPRTQSQRPDTVGRHRFRPWLPARDSRTSWRPSGHC